MRRNLLKRKIALGLSLLILGSSEGVQVLAESVERESTVQAEESAWEESSALEVYNENTEAETEEKYLETSEQITELDEPKSGIEETTHQENTTVLLYAWTRLHMRIHLYEWKWKYIYSLFVYTFFVFIASVADQILWKLDSVILGMKVSAEVVAVYAVAMNLVTIYKKFSGAVSGIFLPRATAMSITDSSEEASVRLMTKVGVIQFLILSLALIGFGIVGQEFLLVWLGDGYEEVYIIFLILAFSLMIPSCQSIGINILEARNKHKFRAVVCCILAVVNGVFTYLVVPKYGMIGAASCTAGAVILGQVLILNIYYKVALHLNIVKFFIDTFLRFLLPVSLAGAAAWWFASKLSMYGSWMSLCIKAILVMAVYVAVIIVTVGKRLNGIYHIVNRKGR